MRNMKLYVIGFFALAVIVMMIIIAPAIARRIDGTDEAHRTAVIQQTTLDLERQRLQLQQAQASAPATIAINYLFVAGIAAALVIGGMVAYKRLYSQPLVKHDAQGRLPVPRELLTNMERQNEAMLLIAQAMNQATQVQLATANATARLADEVRITVTSQPRAALPIADAPAPPLPEPAEPTSALDLNSYKLNVLDHLNTSDAKHILLGINGQGETMHGDLHTLMHTGLLAQTGGGKTTALASYGLQLANDPRCQLAVADPHMMELALLEETGAFWKPAPTSAKQAVALLNDVHQEIQRRAELVNRVATHYQTHTGKRIVLNSLDRYNLIAERCKAPLLSALILFADEIKALAALSGDTDTALNAITSEGRKFGIYFVGASQSWKSDVINTDVRAQFWTRIALFGAQYRQLSELFEIPQAEARSYTAQLTAPGMAAFWRRDSGIQVLKIPYIDLDNDAVYDAMQNIRAWRNSGMVAPHIAPQTIDAIAPAIERATERVIARSNGQNVPLLPELERLEIEPSRAKIEVSAEERERIITAAQTVTSRRALCKSLFNVTGGASYDKVKLVCDEMGILA